MLEVKSLFFIFILCLYWKFFVFLVSCDGLIKLMSGIEGWNQEFSVFREKFLDLDQKQLV